MYRFPFVIEINGKVVNDEEKNEARTQFQNFDKILSTQKYYPTRTIQDKIKDEGSSHTSGRNLKQFNKKNAEAAHEFVNNLIGG